MGELTLCHNHYSYASLRCILSWLPKDGFSAVVHRLIPALGPSLQDALHSHFLVSAMSSLISLWPNPVMTCSESRCPPQHGDIQVTVHHGDKFWETDFDKSCASTRTIPFVKCYSIYCLFRIRISCRHIRSWTKHLPRSRSTPCL